MAVALEAGQFQPKDRQHGLETRQAFAFRVSSLRDGFIDPVLDNQMREQQNAAHGSCELVELVISKSGDGGQEHLPPLLIGLASIHAAGQPSKARPADDFPNVRFRHSNIGRVKADFDIGHRKVLYAQLDDLVVAVRQAKTGGPTAPRRGEKKFLGVAGTQLPPKVPDQRIHGQDGVPKARGDFGHHDAVNEKCPERLILFLLREDWRKEKRRLSCDARKKLGGFKTVKICD